jgi:hypothetical protein
MATATRPYIVTDAFANTTRIIQATSQAQARNFVARDRYTVKAASANELIEIMATGVKPEVANDDKAE